QAVIERASFVDATLARVGFIQPLRRVEGVLVDEYRCEILDFVVSRREPEPDTAPPQRHTERRVEIVVVLHGIRGAEASVLQPLCEVAALHGAIRESEEGGIRKRI